MAMRARSSRALAAVLLGCLLVVGTRCPPAAAQRAESRANGDADPAFVGDAQTGQDLVESGFLDQPQQPEVDFGADGQAAEDGYGLVTNATGPAAEYKRLKYTGGAISAYEEEPIVSSGAVGLGCGFGYVGEEFQGAYIGVGSSFYNKGFSCGRCVRIQCDDKACEEPGSSIVAQIVDLCGDCYDADISLAIPAFTNLTGREPNANPNVQVSWEYVECAPFIDGTIKMLVKPNSNAYFQSLNFANSVVPITAVQVNGDRLRHSTSNYWDWNPGQAINPKGPFEIALLGANRQVLRIRTAQLRTQDLKVQFKPAS